MTSSRVGPALLLGAFGAISVLALPHAAAPQLAPRFIRSQLTWVDRAGKKLSVVGSLADYGNLELSPDGNRVAVAVLSDPTRPTRALWIVDVATGRHTAFTSENFDENWMIWSRDGRRVVFNSGRNGGLDLYEAAATAPSALPGDALLVDREAKWPVSWSFDGRYVLYVVANRGGNHILALPLFGDRQPIPFGHAEDNENWAAFSPDGKWVAYSSTESGGAEVYLAAFPPAASGRAWRVSSGGGTQARWRRDGRELYYMSGDRRITAVSIEARGAADLDIGAERALFEVAYPYGQYHAFDVTADGQRFLVNALVTTTAVRSNAH